MGTVNVACRNFYQHLSALSQLYPILTTRLIWGVGGVGGGQDSNHTYI